MEESTAARNVKAELEQLLNPGMFFEGLPEETLREMICHIVSRNHPANQVILLEHDWGGSVYFIIEGWVKIRTYNKQGKEVTLNILGSGEVFGEMSAMDEVPRSTDVITLTPTRLCSVPSGEFLQVLEKEPLVGIRLSQLMAKRLRQVNRRLRLREADSTSRVADVLLFLAEGQGKPVDQGVTIPNLPHRELSSLSGLARETVTRVLAKLEKGELIKREHHTLHIPSLGNLEDVLSTSSSLLD